MGRHPECRWGDTADCVLHQVREAALQLLAELPTTALTPYFGSVAKLMTDTARAVRLAALLVLSLASPGEPSVTAHARAIANCVEDQEQDEHVRAAALAAISVADPTGTLAPLSPALLSKARHRHGALHSHVLIGDATATARAVTGAGVGEHGTHAGGLARSRLTTMRRLSAPQSSAQRSLAVSFGGAARDGGARDGASFGAVPSGDPSGSLDEALGTALGKRSGSES